MGVSTKLELRIPSILGFEKLAMDFAASAAQMVKLPEPRVENLKTAVSEACLNAIEHGNKLNRSVRVGIEITLDDFALEVAVHDEEGTQIPTIPVPDIDEKIAGRETARGWGLFLIKQLADEVQFESSPHGGNIVRIIFRLDTENPSRERIV